MESNASVLVKRIVSFVIMLCVVVALMTGLSGCTEADNVNYNLNREADAFNCERKITVYNARTDMIIMEITGYIALSNNDTNELVVTVKVGEEKYKKNYVYLNEYTIYVVEDITGTHTDPYHYEIQFKPTVITVNEENDEVSGGGRE